MPATQSPSAVKTIGPKGQISLGRRYAGRQVLVEEQEPGVWLVRTVTVIPDDERWLHEPRAAADLGRALDWASVHPADDTGTGQVLDRLADDQG
jgi:hypothetical protein